MLLSIIVPYFCVERYLPECLINLEDLPQDNVEILFVDDCGGDRSYELINNWISDKENRRIIKRNDNGGLSAARNTGLDAAVGEYVFFLDSDDIPNAKAILRLVSNAKANGLDLIKACFVYFDDITGEQRSGPKLPHVTGTGASLFVDESNAGIYEPMVWQCIYRRSFLKEHHLRMPEGILFEDELFQAPALIEAAKAASCEDIIIQYRQREGSIMGSFGKSTAWCNSYLQICKSLTQYCRNDIDKKASNALQRRIGQIALNVAKNIEAYQLKGLVLNEASDFLYCHSKELAGYAFKSKDLSLCIQGCILWASPKLFRSIYGVLSRIKTALSQS